jgi:hypothetical protein
MKHPLVLFPILVPLVTPPAFGRMPEFNVKAVCKARSSEAMQSTPGQGTADCVRDEEDAKQQLNTLWESTSASLRNRCESDARALGTTSYLDLLACIQIAEDENMKPGPQKQAGKR